MRKILTFVLLLTSLCMFAQQKKVAVYIAKNDNWAEVTKKNAVVFANALQFQVNQLPQYTAVERSNKYLALLSADHAYQRNGQVDESQVAELGKQDGVDIVLGVSIIEYSADTWYVVWKMIDVVTADLISGNYLMKRVADILEVDGIAKELSAQIKGVSNVETPSSTTPAQSNTTVVENNDTKTSSSERQQVEKLSDGGYHILYIRRPFEYAGSALAHHIEINGIYVGNLQSAGHIAVRVPSGQIILKDFVGVKSYEKLRVTSAPTLIINGVKSECSYIRIDEASGKIIQEDVAKKDKYKATVLYDLETNQESLLNNIP